MQGIVDRLNELNETTAEMFGEIQSEIKNINSKKGGK